MSTEDERYPIGQFEPPASIDPPRILDWIDDIAALPADFRAAVTPLSDSQLDTPYRAGGWTVRQVTHHVADSHINSFVRFKWALSEERPTIKAYDEQAWAELPDTLSAPVELSLDLLERLHARWDVLLRGLDESAFRREFVHPVSGPVDLATNVGIYAWHGRHHLAHVTGLVEREGWGG